MVKSKRIIEKIMKSPKEIIIIIPINSKKG